MESHLPKVAQQVIHKTTQFISKAQDSKSTSSTKKLTSVPTGFCSASHRVALDTSFSLSNLQILKLWNEVGSDYPQGSIRTQTQSFNGRASSDFQILVPLSDAETPHPTPHCLPPQIKLYQPLPISSYGGVHSRINRKARFFPPPWAPGQGLSTLHAVSHFIIKTPW